MQEIDIIVLSGKEAGRTFGRHLDHTGCAGHHLRHLRFPIIPENDPYRSCQRLIADGPELDLRYFRLGNFETDTAANQIEIQIEPFRLGDIQIGSGIPGSDRYLLSGGHGHQSGIAIASVVLRIRIGSPIMNRLRRPLIRYADKSVDRSREGGRLAVCLGIRRKLRARQILHVSIENINGIIRAPPVLDRDPILLFHRRSPGFRIILFKKSIESHYLALLRRLGNGLRDVQFMDRTSREAADAYECRPIIVLRFHIAIIYSPKV